MDSSRLAFRRTIRNASILGLAALILNLLTQKASPSNFVPLGNLFLFASASVYGVLGGLISAIISEIPRLIMNSNDGLLVLKNVALAGVIGVVTNEFPFFPNPFALTLFWLSGIAFLAWSMGELSSPILVRFFIYDLWLLAVAKMLLLSTTVSTWLISRLRYLPAQLLLPECLFIAFSFIGGLFMIAPIGQHHLYDLLSQQMGPWALLAVALLFNLPVIFGLYLTHVIADDYGDEFRSTLFRSSLKGKFRPLSHGRKRVEDRIIAGLIPQQSQPEGIDYGELSISADGSVLFLSSLFRQYAQLRSEGGVGANIYTLTMHPLVKDAIISLMQEPCGATQPIRELRIENALGNSQFFEIELGRNQNKESGAEQFFFKIKNITERRTVESHLLQAKKMESLGAMVSGIAHSFNDALTAVTGQASFAELSKDDRVVHQALKAILETSKQAGTLIQQLLDYTNDSSSLQKDEDLVQLIDARSELICRSGGDSFELLIEKTVSSLPVRCNTNLVMQAVTNLLLNAMESYENGTGKIFIHVDKEEISPEMCRIQPRVRPGTFARIRVQDNGVGMNQEVLSKAFDPLFTTKQNSGHSGLGLSIVFAVVRAHDGFLTAESSPSSGTTISLYFPIVSQAEVTSLDSARATKDEHSLEDRKLLGKKVLAVEDDPSVRTILELLLTSIGVTPYIFESGAHALESIETLQFDLFLVDLVLPAMSGTLLATKIRAIKGDSLPGILMSGYMIDDQHTDAHTTVLRKPFDLEDLKRALLNALSCSP